MAGGRVRIIAGRWRGRRLVVEDEPDVRPTPDRVRETVFNWLAPDLPGARCLDLFAGTGALGFEALSRGAARAVLVDRSRAVVDRLRCECDRLGAAESVSLVETDAVEWLSRSRARAADSRFDIVFVDPPQRLEVHREVALGLAERGWLAPGARVWFEVVRRRDPPDLPPGWAILRNGQAGDVRYYLAAAG